jgi:hypothetical protein
MIRSKKLLVSVILCVSCSRNETPDLPDLERKSFSYDAIMQKQSILKDRIHDAQQSVAALDRTK